MRKVDLAVIGGGPAGLAAAIAAREEGVENLLILERESSLGGILNQCIHNGFGLHTFKEELTGPEYAERYSKRVKEMGIPALLDTMVLDITPDRRITAVNDRGILDIQAKAVILAMGCRERPRGALNIPGRRPVGVYTAGTAQKYVNIDGYLPGKEVVVLGSGDIGLIMARRMTLEGASVKAVVELMPYSGGLKRNIVQCLDDYGIPLLLSHTITEVLGRNRVEGVKIAQVNENRMPIPETERLIPCDTLLLSVGLLPENELSKMAGVILSPVTGGAIVGESLQTNVEGVFSCGNVLHVHDLVDFVSEESAQAGRNAAGYIRGKRYPAGGIKITPSDGIRYTVPSFIPSTNIDNDIKIRLRVSGVYKNSRIVVSFDGIPELDKKARIFTPGEMETIVLKKEILEKHPGAAEIAISVRKGL